jgi:hypothetical protein
MRRICSVIPLLLSDERSAVRRKAAVLFGFIVLGIAGSGVLLMALGDHAWRGADRRVLTASHDLAATRSERPLVTGG